MSEFSLPEIERRWASDCGRVRLLLGGVTVTVLGASLSAAWSASEKRDFDLFVALFVLQALLLLAYGTTRVIASISDEKKEGTWDLQRLTPQSAGELALGKLIGAPLYPLFLAAAFAPWVLLALWASPKTDAGAAFCAYALLGGAAAFCWSMSLMISAYSDERTGVGDGVKVLLLIALYPTLTSIIASSLDPRAAAVRFFGLPFPPWTFYSGSMLAFAAWAFEAARARIAIDKLETARSWRLPAFALFLFAYEVGLSPDGAPLAVVPPLAVVLAAALGEPWGLQEWRGWIARPAGQRELYAPAWLTGLLACAALAAFAAASPNANHITTSAASPRYPALLVAFAARDLLFIQWCRLKVKRRPEMLAVVYIAIAYALPAFVAGILHLQNVAYFFCPSPENGVSAALNLLPGAAQAAGAAALLYLEVERGLARPARAA